MKNFDLAALLSPIPGASPCGRDLESSHELYALQVAAREPEEPGLKGLSAVDGRDWSGIAQQALTLLAQSRDLRLVVLLARALLQTHGLVGYGTAISLGRGLLERYWEQVYPLLEDDGRDGDLRLNTLRELWSPPVVSSLRASVVLSTRELGAVTVNDVLLARGAASGRASATATPPQHVAHVLATADAAEHAKLTDSVRTASADLHFLVDFIGRHLGMQSTIHPKPLVSARDERPVGILDVLVAAFSERVAASSQVATPLEPSVPEAAPVMVESQAAAMRVIGEASSRDDVLQLLDHVCRYYATYEPSSPVPLLIERARRVSTMSFLDIVRDLADKGLPQIEAWAGKDSKG